jgi:hypothetical protein
LCIPLETGVLPVRVRCGLLEIIYEAQEGEGDEEGEEGGEVGVHVGFSFLLLHITQLALKQFAARDGGLSKILHR